MSPRLKKWIVYTGSMIAIVLAMTTLLELVLRGIGPPRDRFYVWPPGMHVTFEPLPEYLPGVEGLANVIINSDGLRGDDIPDNADYRVLVLGGSSSECSYLDQPEAWPQQFQEQLQQTMSGRRVWVGNAGRSGITSRHHVAHLQFLLPQLDRIDLIVVFGGVNDLTYRLAADDSYNPHFMDETGAERTLVRRSFSIRPDSYNKGLPPLQRLELSRRITDLMWVVARRTLLPDDHGLIYEERRTRRRGAARFRGELPDIDTALDEYERNIRTMVKLANERGCRIVFLTHPSMWQDDMPPELTRLLWFRTIGDHRTREPGEYYSVAALREGLDRFNQRLLNTCTVAGVDCLDLQPVVPADTTAFYDDVHLNEQGAALVANLTARFVLLNLQDD